MEFLEGINDLQEIQETGRAVETSDDYDNIAEIHVELVNGVDGFGDELLLVTGNPFGIVGELDSVQGDNPYHAAGDCGLVSCANYLTICGVRTNEDELVKFALEHGLCSYNPFGSPADWGGTRPAQQEAILECYGVESSIYGPDEASGSLEGVANAIEGGHAVLMNLNAGYLWDRPDCVDSGQMNHAVTVTGTVRNSSGELVALTICDSGRGLMEDSCRAVPVSVLEECYAEAAGACVVISDNAVR